VLVLHFNFASDQRQPWTGDHVRQRIFTDADSTAAFYAEQSYGRTQLIGKLRSDGDVFGWYTIAASPAVCDVNAWTSQVRQAARDAGVDLSGYDHTIYAFPSQSSCGWSGVGDVGDSAGGWSWLNGDIGVRVVSHELGHNLGLHHASSYSCTDSGGAPAAISSTCTVAEYGDPFDVMGGYGSRHSHGWHLHRLGYLGASNVRTITSSGTYTVRSAIAPSSDVQLLRIPRRRAADGTVLDYYYLDLRTAGGVFDDFLTTDPVVRGVGVRVNPEPTVTTQSWLIDTTPGSADFFRDASLAVGRTFTDGTVSITTTALAGDTATVTVNVPDTTPPTAPAGLTAVVADGRVRLTWDASTDDVSVARYVVSRDGAAIASTGATAFEETGPPPGSYEYAVTAYDAAGNAGPRATVTALMPEPPATPGPLPPSTPPARDRTAPEVRIRSVRPGNRRRKRLVVIASARDDVALARVELWLDGVRRKSVTTSSLTYIRRVRSGNHRIEVRAWDTTGNRGSATRRVVTRTR
jgi:hypothetical protein